MTSQLFSSNTPITAITQSRKNVAGDLAGFFKKMDIPNSNSMHGYGLHLDITHDNWTVKSHPYCMCENLTCPYCTVHFTPQDMEVSAHKMLTLEPHFRELGFVENEGAPNLWIYNPDLNVDVRIWWYKYLGRAMQILNTHDTPWNTIITYLNDFAEKTHLISQKKIKITALSQHLNIDPNTLFSLFQTEESDVFINVVLEQIKASKRATHSLKEITKLLDTHTLTSSKIDMTPHRRLEYVLKDPRISLKSLI
jgi:hypothetical protein